MSIKDVNTTKAQHDAKLPVKRMGNLQSIHFIAEANILCDKITKGMNGLDMPHSFESYEDLILAILKVKALEIQPYANSILTQQKNKSSLKSDLNE